MRPNDLWRSEASLANHQEWCLKLLRFGKEQVVDRAAMQHLRSVGPAPRGLLIAPPEAFRQEVIFVGRLVRLDRSTRGDTVTKPSWITGVTQYDGGTHRPARPSREVRSKPSSVSTKPSHTWHVCKRFALELGRTSSPRLSTETSGQYKSHLGRSLTHN